VEIREVDPAPKVKQAMEEQTSAERMRRAAILRADGEKRAAILSAEGSKRARILQAEGVRQSKVLEAEGERLASSCKARVRPEAAHPVVGASPAGLQGAGRALDADHAESGASQSTKWILPFEVTKVLEACPSSWGSRARPPPGT
jgi:regulator of protease activity HflC (stomatin/prohibitin superfamily)